MATEVSPRALFLRLTDPTVFAKELAVGARSRELVELILLLAGAWRLLFVPRLDTREDARDEVRVPIEPTGLRFVTELLVVLVLTLL